MKNFSEIKSRNELADFLQFPRNKITYLLYIKGTENLYESFDIPKKNGEVRCIHAPNEELKNVQKKLAEALYKHINSCRQNGNMHTKVSHGFEPGRSFITNAKIHRNKRIVVNLDLEDFFGSFHFGRVRGYFEKNNNFLLPRDVATVLAQLTCYQGTLPQGAPTSPVITNMICAIMDERILKCSKKYKLDYTRYADDLTFSTNDWKFLDKQEEFWAELRKEITNAGFKINEDKTRVQLFDSRQEVTGLVVNQKLRVNRDYYMTTRAMAHHLYKTGEFFVGDESGTVQQLEGRFTFINQLEWYNNKHDLSGTPHKYETLNGREKQYSKILFYKYFFANEKPLVVTEGKTDVRYLKAALKNMYQDYPDLVSKDENDYFVYKISFLKRSKRLAYFLNIKIDGADTLQNIVHFYSDKNNKTYPNYMDELIKLRGATPEKPVVLLLDNEIADKTKPIAKIMKNMEPCKIEELKSKHMLHIKDNLFLLVTPLPEGEEQSDIETLFPKEVLEMEIDGKRFDKSDKYDKSVSYGKDTFSKYVLREYKSIDFQGFRPLLDNIVKLVRKE